MAFGRKILMNVGVAGVGVTLSALDVEFNIEKSITENPNNAEFKIYNVAPLTRNRFLIRGASVLFNAGYDDEGIGLIFAGTVNESTTQIEGNDWITTLFCSDFANSKTPFRTTVVNLSFIAGLPLSTVISTIGGLMGGIPIKGLENISTVTLKSNWTFTGTITGALIKIKKQLRSNGFGFYFNNGEMFIYNKSIPTIVNVVLVSASGGLIGSVRNITDETKSATKKRVAFTSLLNADLRLGSTIVLNSENAKGSFYIQKAIFRGNNFGGDFLTEVEASA